MLIILNLVVIIDIVFIDYEVQTKQDADGVFCRVNKRHSETIRALFI